MSKALWTELAICGGQPTFSSPLHVGRPNIGDRHQLQQRFNDILDRRWLSNDGPCVKAFEEQIASLLKVKHCIAVCNATIGLEIACAALGLSGEVIVPSFTFVASAHALQWRGITPVFCDIAPGTHHLDPQRVREAITPRTTGILGVHVWGTPCDIDGLKEIADDHQLSLLFDAAHAFGCSYRGTMIGNFGDIEVFSFHATKFINAFEGGALTTNDDELAARARSMRNFGFAGYDDVESIGTNGKMTEICAAMGLTSLESLESFVKVNRDHYRRYRERLDGVPGVTVVSYDESERCNFQYVVVEIDEGSTGISRDDLVRALHAENVLARRYFYPGCHQMEPYRSRRPQEEAQLPRTERVTQQVMTLPTGTGVDDEVIDDISDLIGLIVGSAPAILDRMSTEADAIKHR
jgi:dTDP-4-amino-4,6-dideoxygalactose transaminase